jgi:hypothetical protein
MFCFSPARALDAVTNATTINDHHSKALLKMVL